MRYNVIFMGKLQPGQDIEAVKAKLMAAWGITKAQVEVLFTKQEVVLKKNLDLSLAKKYKQKFEQSGAVCEIRQVRAVSEKPPSEAKPAKPASPTPLREGSNSIECPKCGHLQSPSLECSNCGLIFSKYGPPATPAKEEIRSATEEVERSETEGEESSPSAKKKWMAGIPRWAWIPAFACFAIPVVSLGGAIFGALGGGAGGYCLTVAKKTGRSVRVRAIHCAVIVVLSWTAFLALFFMFAGHFPWQGDDNVVTTRTVDSSGREVVKVRRRSPSAKTDLSDWSTRQEIYAMATEFFYDSLKEAYESPDRDTDFEKSYIAHLEDMHERLIQSTMEFYNITHEQVVAVIEEGDMLGWERR